MNTQDFKAWLARMGFDRHGGQSKAAEALGVSTGMLRRYTGGKHPDGSPVNYPRTLDLACAALAMGLRPFSEYRQGSE